jgi:pyruvyltransferase
VLYELYYKRFTENSNFFKLINPLDPAPIKMINDVLSCEKIIASSLHGLALGIAYGIPTQWCKITNKIIGGNMKFLDFYSSIDEITIKVPRAISDIVPMSNDEIYAHIGETRYTDKITTIQNNLLAVFETLKNGM